VDINHQELQLYLFNMKYNKERLFEVMGKLNPSFKPTLNEDVMVDNMRLSNDDLNEILKGYLETALWTEEERLNDERGTNNDAMNSDFEDESDETESEIQFMRIMKNNLQNKSIESFTREDIDPNSLIQAYLDIKNFITAAGSVAITEALTENDKFQLGMDIWLTRNRHGAGFFDRNYEHEKELETAAQNLKEVDMYIGDDNKLHFSNSQ
jgi:hypothetical protein